MQFRIPTSQQPAVGPLARLGGLPAAHIQQLQQQQQQQQQQQVLPGAEARQAGGSTLLQKLLLRQQQLHAPAEPLPLQQFTHPADGPGPQVPLMQGSGVLQQQDPLRQMQLQQQLMQQQQLQQQQSQFLQQQQQQQQQQQLLLQQQAQSPHGPLLQQGQFYGSAQQYDGPLFHQQQQIPQQQLLPSGAVTTASSGSGVLVGRMHRMGGGGFDHAPSGGPAGMFDEYGAPVLQNSAQGGSGAGFYPGGGGSALGWSAPPMEQQQQQQPLMGAGQYTGGATSDALHYPVAAFPQVVGAGLVPGAMSGGGGREQQQWQGTRSDGRGQQWSQQPRQQQQQSAAFAPGFDGRGGAGPGGFDAGSDSRRAPFDNGLRRGPPGLDRRDSGGGGPPRRPPERDGAPPQRHDRGRDDAPQWGGGDHPRSGGGGSGRDDRDGGGPRGGFRERGSGSEGRPREASRSDRSPSPERSERRWTGGRDAGGGRSAQAAPPQRYISSGHSDAAVDLPRAALSAAVREASDVAARYPRMHVPDDFTHMEASWVYSLPAPPLHGNLDPHAAGGHALPAFVDAFASGLRATGDVARVAAPAAAEYALHGSSGVPSVLPFGRLPVVCVPSADVQVERAAIPKLAAREPAPTSQHAGVSEGRLPVRYFARVALLSDTTLPPVPTAGRGSAATASEHLLQRVRCLVVARDAPRAYVMELPGGPWSAELDGGDPNVEDACLVRTAARHLLAQSGIDLAPCREWVKLCQLHSHRPRVIVAGTEGSGEKLASSDEQLEVCVVFLCLDAHAATLCYAPDPDNVLRWLVRRDSGAPSHGDTVKAVNESSGGDETGASSEVVRTAAGAASDSEELSSLRYEDLRARCKAAGMPTKGRKEELLARLLQLPALEGAHASKPSAVPDTVAATAVALTNDASITESTRGQPPEAQAAGGSDEKAPVDSRAPDGHPSSINAEDKPGAGGRPGTAVPPSYACLVATCPGPAEQAGHSSAGIAAAAAPLVLKLVSLRRLLSYNDSDRDERTFEASVCAECVAESLFRDCVRALAAALWRLPDPPSATELAAHVGARKRLRSDTDEAQPAEGGADADAAAGAVASASAAQPSALPSAAAVPLLLPLSAVRAACAFLDRAGSRGSGAGIDAGDLEGLLLRCCQRMSRGVARRLVSRAVMDAAYRPRQFCRFSELFRALEDSEKRPAEADTGGSADAAGSPAAVAASGSGDSESKL